MMDPLGKIVVELRDATGVAAIVGVNPTSSPARVRGGEPAPGDAQGPGSYRAFIVVTADGRQRWKRVPVQRPRYAVKCFGRTKQEAQALANAASDALHERGERVHANGLGIWNSWEDGGGEDDADPDTDQPFVPLFIDVIATTQAVA